ncbi:MAG: hypothetical protein L0177_18680 [Chloroflexi bacterium]|nr:hypothetical protein [Chloroflexota bacterium]
MARLERAKVLPHPQPLSARGEGRGRFKSLLDQIHLPKANSTTPLADLQLPANAINIHPAFTFSDLKFDSLFTMPMYSHIIAASLRGLDFSK